MPIRNSLKKFIEPTGFSKLTDDLILRLWDWCHIARKMATFPMIESRMVDPRTRTGFTEEENIRAEFYRNCISNDLSSFWLRSVCDKEYGGFITHLDRFGNRYDMSGKYAAMQGRTIFGLATSYNVTPSDELIEAAESGYNFLKVFFQDNANGGWYHRVTRDGSASNTEKYTFDQAAVIVGFCRFYSLTGNRELLDDARKTWECTCLHATDKVYQGFYWFCDASWNVRSAKKWLFIHLEMVSAGLALYDVTSDHRYLEHVIDIVNTIINRMQDRKHALFLEAFHPDWNYNPLATRDKIRLGLNLKFVWLLLKLFEKSQLARFSDLSRDLLDRCIFTAWIKQPGVFFQYAFRNGSPANDVIEWSLICDAMIALIMASFHLKKKVYFDCFEQISRFGYRYLHDPEHGEWYHSCRLNGDVQDDRKGGEWKTCYHTIEACYECSQYLDKMQTSGLDKELN